MPVLHQHSTFIIIESSSFKELPSALQTFCLINYHTIFLWQGRKQDTLPYLKCGTAEALSDLSSLPSGHARSSPGLESWGCRPHGQKATTPARDHGKCLVQLLTYRRGNKPREMRTLSKPRVTPIMKGHTNTTCIQTTYRPGLWRERWHCEKSI